MLLLVGSVWLLRLYRSTRRVTQNLEEITGILLNRVARPLSVVPPVMEVVRNVVELVQEYRGKDSKSSDEENALRRIGSNIRKQNSDARAKRVMRNIIRYSVDEPPRNDYPKRIISPPRPSSCCSDENREAVGSTREIDGFKFCYKICTVCGHAVKFYFPAVASANEAVKGYRQWKRYMAQ